MATIHRSTVLLLLTAVACGGDEFQARGSSVGAGPTGANSGGSAASTSGGGVGGGVGATGAMGGAGGAPECPVGDSCVQTVDAAWTGPVAAYLGEDPAPGCGAGWEVELDGFVGDVSGDVTCSACLCGGAVGAGCGVPPLTVYSDQSCDTVTSNVTLISNACKALPAGAENVNRGQVPIVPGQCAPSGGVAGLSAPQWELDARLCAAVDGRSCQGGVCVPTPDPGLTWPCVYRTGDQECPEPYASKTILHLDVLDTRGCSDCACATPTGGICAGTVNLFPASCDVSGVAASMDPSCSLDLGNGFAFAKYVPGQQTPGTCAAAGGAPEGTLMPANPVTVCCQ
ncbi:MAG: hypothetical protein WKG00_13560 [Polyangiaceae bacterium]